jgi:Domain of Unknown Function (DUF1080)
MGIQPANSCTETAVATGYAPIGRKSYGFLMLLACGLLARVAWGEVPILNEPKLLDQKLLEEGWVALFDGQTLFGWKSTTDVDWHVEGGAIVATSGKPGFLQSSLPCRDFECYLEFQADTETNSGLFFRSVEHPTDPAQDCVEVNIAPADNPFPTGSLVARTKAETSLPATSSEWRSLWVSAKGDAVVVSVDGRQTSKGVDPMRPGALNMMLQFNTGRIAFRNIRVRPLGMRPLFNGTDLKGWKTDQVLQSDFRVEAPGVLRVRQGPGQLETDGEFGDFLLHIECQTHAAGLNSGVFFRCIPGDRLMGYEAQISNAWKENRSQPLDAGTGAIFRRQAARYVPANDEEWFTMTLAALGPRISSWVNGLQVCDWIDTRPPDPNPRKGLRLQPGSIMLQGHDPTTDVSFRTLRILELK